MGASRAQGRPKRGSAEVGRDKIIGKLRSVVRSGVKIDLSRKTLSEHAGVTPALISYYFPTKDTLLEEISAPILRSYRQRMEFIICDTTCKDVKLQQIVTLLINLYINDGRMLDLYAGLTLYVRGCDVCEITKMTNLLENFFSSWPGTASENRLDVAVLQGAIWGMCRFAARIDSRSTEDVLPLISKVVGIVSMSLSKGMHVQLA